MFTMKQSLITALFVLLASLFFVDKASAQAMPLLSDPVKIREFERMSEKLDLTLLQQEAAIEVYDRYLDTFSRVRKGEIQAFEDSIADATETFGFMQFSIPERDLIEDLIRKAKRAIKAIHRSDSSFFEEISGMLTEKQRVILTRTQIARELEAYEVFIQFMIGQLNEGAGAQIRKYYDSLQHESNKELDEVMDQYDQRYLKEVKQGFDAVVETIGLILDMIDELGIRDQDQQALMMKYMMDEGAIEDLKRRGDLLLKPLVDQAYAISQLNWKTWKKIDALLDTDDAKSLRDRYFNASFRTAMRGGSKIEKYINRALKHSDLLESQRIDLEELQSSFETKWKKKTKNHAELLEKSRQIQSVATMMGESTTPFVAKLAKLEEEREAYIQATEDRIDSILGTVLAKALHKSNASPMKFLFDQAMVDESMDSTESVQIIVGSSTTHDIEMTDEQIESLIASGEFESVDGSGSMVVSSSISFGEPIEMDQLESVEADPSVQFASSTTTQGTSTIPKPIAPSFPARSSVVLGLDENGEVIIGAVYDEYREKYTLARETVSIESKKISDDVSLTHAERLRKNREISQGAAASVAVLDTAFFDDLATITDLQRDDLNLKMLENHRDRQRTSVPDDPFGWRGGEGDTIDLVGLYVMSDVSDDLHEGISTTSIQEIRTAMQQYHDQITSVHKSFVDAQYEMNHMEDAMYLISESQTSGRVAESVQGKWMDTFTNLRDAKRALMLANQEVMDTLLKVVPESDFWKVRMEYVKKAYPDVFKKSLDITTMLKAAVSIPNLDPALKGQLETLATSYRSDYWNICEAMIDNHKSNASAVSGNQMMSKEDMHRQLRLETLRFDRKELNDRMRMRLRMVLSEDQIKHVPGLRPTVTASAEK